MRDVEEALNLEGCWNLVLYLWWKVWGRVVVGEILLHHDSACVKSARGSHNSVVRCT